jgi:hypothetical protein
MDEGQTFIQSWKTEELSVKAVGRGDWIVPARAGFFATFDNGMTCAFILKRGIAIRQGLRRRFD